ncbi:TMV resistance protein N-like isoform X2 [Momordica charantia]|uniref:TMV resistance protein N-like isoform X2 n=1 Tax=Momordica charantia TaxID=3673 RepID=A0A6J1C544_MOMCH|nr:TMV resistance protein N-like isoform X2 [Momordica charantia]
MFVKLYSKDLIVQYQYHNLMMGLFQWPESKFLQDVVKETLNKLNCTLLYIAKYPVGLESRIQDLYMLLDTKSDDVRMIGICGIGGIGKTTIAKAVYNLIADQFESCTFLANIREQSKQKLGLIHLQEALLYEALGCDNVKLGSTDKGINVIRNKLRNKRVFLVLDDVDQTEQLEALAGGHDWFGSGSRIVFTTRDDHLLVSHGVQYTYKVKELSNEDSLRLFSSHAFRNPCPPKGYEEFISFVLNYAKGLPLALMVLGSFLCGRRISEWKSALDKLRRIPDKRIYEVLKISFDGLEDNEQSIFLDVACFFKGENKDHVVNVLDGCDFYADNGIRILVDKCLVTIEYNKLWMHDLLQEMGWEIVRQESPRFPGQRSRLCFEEDVAHVLSENMGTHNIEGIKLDLPEANEICISAEAFSEMRRLRILMIHDAHLSGKLEYLPNELRLLKWSGYPCACLPSNFHPKKLVALILWHGRIEYLWKDFKVFNNLKIVDLSFCKFLVEIPDFSGIPNVETLDLNHCTSLVEVHESVGMLQKLATLSLLSCSSLQRLPPNIKLKSLSNLFLADCSKLEAFPNILEKMKYIEGIHLEKAAIRDLPLSISNLIGLKTLNLGFCKNLEVLPCSIGELQHLQLLNLMGCSKLREIPKLPSNLLYLCADDCKSLESYSQLSEFIMLNAETPLRLVLSFANCQNLVENQSNDAVKFSSSEGSMVDIKLPGSEVPECFDFHGAEGSVALQIASSLYGKPATWFFYAVFGPEDSGEATGKFSCGVVVSINHEKTIVFERCFNSLESDHIWIMSFCPGPLTWILNGKPWTRFDVSFLITAVSTKVAATKVMLKKCGFHHKYKRDSNLNDSPLVRKYAKRSR